MARPQQQDAPKAVGFKDIQLFKAQSLGVGSYGAVCKAKCDDLICAAKLLHPILFEPAARSKLPPEGKHKLPISRFEQECEFLDSIKHPNIVQYLGTQRDPDNGLPVLLMELMDQSLTSFLEDPQQTIPYHIQVTISCDITLALSFLHSNGIIHRDLSSNNVLMIGNCRAKVTDFGMAKLAGSNPQASLTQTPGADVYMSPEATRIPPVYSEKIDCFSHGVLGVQIVTRKFPNPGDRLKMMQIADPKFPSGEARVEVPEVERRREHIDLIDKSHPLLPIALDCLKDKEGERPSAQEICSKLTALKQASKFVQSVQEQAKPQTQSTADEGQLKRLQDMLQVRYQEIQMLKNGLRDAVSKNKATDSNHGEREQATVHKVPTRSDHVYANVDDSKTQRSKTQMEYANVGKTPSDQLVYANLDGTEPKQVSYANVEKPQPVVPHTSQTAGHVYANVNEKQQQQQQHKRWWVALYDYEAQGDRELTLKKLDVLEVIDSTDLVWWTGKLNGRVGVFPASYTEEFYNGKI